MDCQGQVLLPGWVDAHTHVGLWGEAEGRASYDGNESSGPITAQVRGLDAVNPAHHSFADARSIGTTTVQTGPGSGNILGGELLTIKTAGTIIDHMVLRAPSGLKSALGENPKRFHGEMMKRMPSTRMGSAAMLREWLIKGQEYRKKMEQGKADPDLGLLNVVKVLNKEIPLRVHAHRADDIVTAIRIAKEFDLCISLEHCTEGHLIADYLAEAGFPACVGPTLGHRSKVETQNLSFDTPFALYKAGVKFALITDHPFVPIPFYNIVGALATAHGLPEEAALRAMTLSPAEILGVDHRVGSLEVGKDADFVIWSGHPFKTRSRVLRTYINGQVVYQG
ncbi:Imidazolonepropionase [bioreactor metagenome]|uniref:Imidazolonepropionase n=1 Tax=bioreactor metagenome TaxID=1076179 RepID=A0A645B5G9_9ZZZZ